MSPQKRKKPSATEVVKEIKRRTRRVFSSEEKLITREQEKRLVELELENKKKDLADIAISLSQKQEWARELNQHLQIIESSKGSQRNHRSCR